MTLHASRPSASVLVACALALLAPVASRSAAAERAGATAATAGTGLYRSTDAGRTWSPAGLAGTRHIGAVHVDPRDANVVVVAALGAVFGPSEARGVYRSTDGGRTWQRIGGEGWPQGALGRIGIAAAHANGATRLYASISSESGAAGFWRSDDDGAHWTKVNDAGWVTSWYMSRITVSPVDPERVYTVGQSLHESRDGGRTWTTFRGAPGGDDFHYLWIDPKDPQRMIASADQGTIVTVNGGATWSEWYNQPTGQFYYLTADDRFPYRIYSGQQDSGTVRIASRGDDGWISFRDWEPVGGEERDYDVADPDDPDIVYGSGLGGTITKWDARTGEVQHVAPWPVTS